MTDFTCGVVLSSGHIWLPGDGWFSSVHLTAFNYPKVWIRKVLQTKPISSSSFHMWHIHSVNRLFHYSGMTTEGKVMGLTHKTFFFFAAFFEWPS